MEFQTVKSISLENNNGQNIHDYGKKLIRKRYDILKT